MTPRRALVAGAVVAGALVAATLVFSLRPDAGTAAVANPTAGQAPPGRPVLGQATGHPDRGVSAFVARFSPDATGGHRQSWDVVQAPTGLVYVANSDGVLEYDGADWRLIDVPGFRARAVAVGPSGAVHVGGEGTLGVLAPDTTGRLAYREVAGGADLDGTTIWAAVASDEGVLFQAFDRLVFVVSGRVVDVERAPEGRRFHKAFEAGGALYVRLEGAGLLRYADRELVPVDGGAAVADVPVRVLLDLDGSPGGALLIVTDDELFRLDPGAVDPFVSIPTEATETLQQTRAYHGCPVADGRALAITTTGGGVLVITPGGQVVERFGPAAGLTPDDLVIGCATDLQGGLWLALSEGVARVDVGSPLTTFDSRLGLDGVVYDVVRHDGRLYAATGRGVYRLRPSADAAPATFEPVLAGDAPIDQAWDLLSTERGLLVAATTGVFAIDGLSASVILPETAFSLVTAGRTSDLAVYVGLRPGLAVLRPRGAGWGSETRVEGIEGEVRSVYPTEDGGAWVAEMGGYLIRLAPTGEVDRVYGPGDGVPEGLASVQSIDGNLVVLADLGPYEVDGVGDQIRFTRMDALARAVEETVGDLTQGYGIWTDSEDRVWISGRDRLRALVPRDGQWEDVTPSALRRTSGVWGVHLEGDALWVPTTAGLLRLSTTPDTRYDVAVPALVRSVETSGGGTGADLGLDDGAATVPYRQPVRFRFSAAAFNDAAGTRYRTELVGHDDGPSAWSDERFRDYTNLPPGDYAFRVEARTAQGAPARSATVALRVPPPWYLTTWAALLAALAAGTGVVAIAWAASQHHRKRADAERDRADELDGLNAELRRADALKDTMLANASHELRTPLTAVLGFAEILTDHGPDPEVHRLASHILSGGHRLLRTVNAILESAQLRAGRLTLHPRSVDAAAVVREAVEALAPLADAKGIPLRALPDHSVVPATLDPDALGRVVTNLVGNAVKFTDHGHIVVTVDGADGDLVVSVFDTGHGIDPDFLPRLFEDFEQASTGHGRVAEGNGLGLAITKRLVTLMGGAIDVASEVGVGTTFRVTLPGQVEAGAPSPGAPAVTQPDTVPNPYAPTGDGALAPLADPV
ncbi:ATP-binding protein [Rubrivirga sp.]|uniref:ATP-binding protein n=1 Tax=Rubrivirga sp. TaxID=1885344 RepID=UPI003B527E35